MNKFFQKKGRRRIAPKEKDSIQDSLDRADTKGRRRIVPKEKNLKYETLTFDLSFSITSRQGQVDCSSPKVQYRLLSVIFNQSLKLSRQVVPSLTQGASSVGQTQMGVL